MDPTMLIMLALFVVLMIFMFRSNKKRQKQQQELQSNLVVGAEVMTTSGVYGTITLVDDQDDQVWLESTPGSVIRVHKQAVAKVIKPVVQEAAPAEAAPEDASAEQAQAEPEYGERIEPGDGAEPEAK